MSANKAHKRKEICDIAARLFAKKGFEKTTTRDISKSVGISNGALYYYFSSKEDLLYQILDETLSEGLKLIKEIEQSDKSLKGKLVEITSLYTRYLSSNINKMKLLANEQKSLKPTHKKILDQKQRDYLKVFIKILEDLRREGKMQEIDTTVAAFAFFGMAHWTYRWYDPKGKIKQDQLAELYSRIFTRGIYSDRPSQNKSDV